MAQLSTIQLPSLHINYHVRLLARFLLIALVLFVAFTDLTSAMSKKFIKGFLLGAYMAKHHEPVVVVTKKHGWSRSSRWDQPNPKTGSSGPMNKTISIISHRQRMTKTSHNHQYDHNFCKISNNRIKNVIDLRPSIHLDIGMIYIQPKIIFIIGGSISVIQTGAT